MKSIKHIFVIPNSDDLIKSFSFDRIAHLLIKAEENKKFEVIVSFFYTDAQVNPIYALNNGVVKLISGQFRYNENHYDEESQYRKLAKSDWVNSVVINRNHGFSCFSDLKIGDQFDFAGYILTKTTETEGSHELNMGKITQQINFNFKGNDKVFPL